MSKPELLVFAGSRNRCLTKGICEHLGIPVAESETKFFPDSEVLVKVNEDVRGRDCFVVVSTSSPVNENLMELLLFIDCLKRASAGQVIAVIPYFGYARQDRKNEGRVPISAKLVANLLTAAGLDRVLALDLHAAQIQGFFDIPVDHLSASKIFLDYFRARPTLTKNLCIVSPDAGNAKFVEKMANLLGTDIAIIQKQRKSETEVAMPNLIGSVEGRSALLLDDMITTGSTMAKAAEFCKRMGAESVIAAATHGVLCGAAPEKLANSCIDQIICTNSIDRCNPDEGCSLTGDVRTVLGDKYVELSVAELLGDAILRIHNNESVSQLLAGTAGTKR